MSMMTPKSYLKYYSSALFIFLLISVVLNYYVDPAYIFDNVHEENIAKLLAEGNHVANIPANINDRSLQSAYINQIKSNQILM